MDANKSKFKEMSLIDHITELRKRLLWSFVYIIIIFIICFYFAENLFAFLAKPLVGLLDTDNGQGFIYTALQEAFFTELKIAFFFALFFSFPLIAIQVWKSLTPYLQNADLHLVHLYEESTLSAEYYGKDQMVYLTKVYEFSASHRLHSPALTDEENKAVFGKCNNPYGHGHNYVLEVTIKGEVNPRTGMVADIDLLDRVIEKQVFSRFDHRHLNLDTTEFERVNPTSENFVRVLWEIVEPHLKPVALHRLRLQETPKSYFDYYGDK